MNLSKWIVKIEIAQYVVFIPTLLFGLMRALVPLSVSLTIWATLVAVELAMRFEREKATGAAPVVDELPTRMRGALLRATGSKVEPGVDETQEIPKQ
jgi:hypothetical protein